MFVNGTEYVKIEDAHLCIGGFVIEVEEIPGYYVRISPDDLKQPEQPEPPEEPSLEDVEDVEVIWF